MIQVGNLFCPKDLLQTGTLQKWPASRHRIASVFASWGRIAEDFRSETSIARIFAPHRIATSVFSTRRRHSHRIAARVARCGPLRLSLQLWLMMSDKGISDISSKVKKQHVTIFANCRIMLIRLSQGNLLSLAVSFRPCPLLLGHPLYVCVCVYIYIYTHTSLSICIYHDICCEVVIWSKFGVLESYYLVQVRVIIWSKLIWGLFL